MKVTWLHKFLGFFYSSRRPSQIGPTADFDGAAIPPPIFSMIHTYTKDNFQEATKSNLRTVGTGRGKEDHWLPQFLAVIHRSKTFFIILNDSWFWPSTILFYFPLCLSLTDFKTPLNFSGHWSGGYTESLWPGQPRIGSEEFFRFTATKISC